jgi:hypothetical protein
VQIPQLSPGLDAELLDEGGASGPIRLERFRLATRSGKARA